MIKKSDNKVFVGLALLSLAGCVLWAVYLGITLPLALLYSLPAVGCATAVLIKLFRKIDMTLYLKAYGSSWGLFGILFLLYFFSVIANALFLFWIFVTAIALFLVIIQSVFFFVKYRKLDVCLVLFLSNPAFHLLFNFSVLYIWFWSWWNFNW